METRFKVTGLKELDDLLKELPKRVARTELAAALRAGANVVKAEAKVRAPIRLAGTAIAIQRKKGPATQGRLPGFLRASISVRQKRGTKDTAPTMQVGVGRAFYGMFQEFGTKHQPARPWLRPAFDAAAPRAINAIKERLAKGIAAAAARLGGGAKR